MAAQKGKTKRLGLRIQERDKVAFQKKAEEEGRSLSGWMIHTCKQHVKPTQLAPVRD